MPTTSRLPRVFLSLYLGAPIAGYLPKACGDENSAHHPAILYTGSLAVVASRLVDLVRLHIARGLRKRFGKGMYTCPKGTRRKTMGWKIWKYASRKVRSGHFDRDNRNNILTLEAYKILIHGYWWSQL